MKDDHESNEQFGSTCYSLLAQAQAGEQLAWERLVRLYSPLVIYWGRKSGLTSEDAFDVGQEVLLATHKSLDKFRTDGKKSSFRGWLRTITRRRIADFFRRRAKSIQPVGDGSVAQEIVKSVALPVEPSLGEEKRLLFRQALKIIENEFQEKHQTAFLLMVVEGWKAPDVAEKLGMTKNAVYLARHHILRRLRTEFAELLE